MTKTQQALDLIAGGMSPYAAAHAVGVSTSAVYRAQALEASRERCAACNAPIVAGGAVVDLALRERQRIIEGIEWNLEARPSVTVPELLAWLKNYHSGRTT